MFTAKHSRSLLPAWPMRLVALGCVVLVGLLSLAAVSPDIHAVLHGEHQDSDERAQHREHSENQAESGHICAITLFSQGIEFGCATVLVLGEPEPLFTDVIALADQVARAARAAQLPPGRGPPVG